MNILDQIIEDKKKEIKNDKIINPIKKIFLEIKEKNNFFKKKLIEFKNINKIAIIAEIKKASPSKGILIDDFDHLNIAKEYVENHAACLSILTEKKYFLGNKQFVSDIKKNFNIPILNKDFFIDPYQVYEANKNGADCILIIMNSSSDQLIQELIDVSNEMKMDVILEVHNEKEMEKALKYDDHIIGINNRNLEDFRVSIDTTVRIFKNFENALNNKILISESGFHTNEDIKKIKDNTDINNFLIGESFMKSDSISNCFKKLIK